MDGFSHGTIVMRSAPLKLCISYIQETAFLYTHTHREGMLWFPTRSTLDDFSKLVFRRLITIVLRAHTLRHRQNAPVLMLINGEK